MKRAQAGWRTIEGHRLLDLGESASLERMSEQRLAAEVVARRVELECAARRT